MWHKGKLYRVGGSSTGTVSASTLVPPDVFDFETNSWTLTSIVGVTNGNFLQKMNAAACSHGDEIFIFGGYNLSNVICKTVVAWNPETGNIRQMEDMPFAAINMTAISVGSSIYLIGGESIAVSGWGYLPGGPGWGGAEWAWGVGYASPGTLTGSKKIIKFTP